MDMPHLIPVFVEIDWVATARMAHSLQNGGLPGVGVADD
jgi:hypothetical protein